MQLQSELHALSKEEREAVLQEGQLPIQIPPDHAVTVLFSCVFPLVIIHDIVSSYSYVILYVSLVIEQLLRVES